MFQAESTRSPGYRVSTDHHSPRDYRFPTTYSGYASPVSQHSQPAYYDESPTMGMPIPSGTYDGGLTANLHDPEVGDFSFDPTEPGLGSGLEETQIAEEEIERHREPNSGKNFVGGFVRGLKGFPKALANNYREGYVRRVAAQQGHGEIPTVAVHPPEPSSSSSYDSQDPERNVGTSVSAHATISQAHAPVPNRILSPISVEPALASDYDKMSFPSTPPGSGISIGTYFSLVRQFFADIHALPWIAPDRVTVDYIPGQFRRSSLHRRSTRVSMSTSDTSRRSRRSANVVSWYNNEASRPSVDLLSSGSSSPSVRSPIRDKSLGNNQSPRTVTDPHTPRGTPTANTTNPSTSQNNTPSYLPPIYPVTTSYPGPPPIYPITAPSPLSLPPKADTRSPASIAPAQVLLSHGDARQPQRPAPSASAPRYPHGYVSYQPVYASNAPQSQQTVHGAVSRPATAQIRFETPPITPAFSQRV